MSLASLDDPADPDESILETEKKKKEIRYTACISDIFMVIASNHAGSIHSRVPGNLICCLVLQTGCSTAAFDRCYYPLFTFDNRTLIINSSGEIIFIAESVKRNFTLKPAIIARTTSWRVKGKNSTQHHGRKVGYKSCYENRSPSSSSSQDYLENASAGMVFHWVVVLLFPLF